nr:hypothetical protein [Abditibacterium utsteinense]
MAEFTANTPNRPPNSRSSFANRALAKALSGFSVFSAAVAEHAAQKGTAVAASKKVRRLKEWFMAKIQLGFYWSRDEKFTP